MANVRMICESIRLCRAARITPFIWGHRGLGKSTIVKQVADMNGLGFIDLRCSQLEASDIRGLPDNVGGRTSYLPPAEMPVGDLTDEQYFKLLGEIPQKDSYGSVPDFRQAMRDFSQSELKLQPRRQGGILFLDEVNRAQDDVLQAVFQLVLDHKVGLYRLPDDWMVVCAGNYMEGGQYQVSGFNDEAFLSRFCHVQLSGGQDHFEDWMHYMSKYGEAATPVIEFVSQNIDHLYGKPVGSLGFSVTPNPRSWEKAMQVIVACNQGGFSEEAKVNVLSGLIGTDMAVSFGRYSCPVRPHDLLKNGVKAHADKMQTLNRNQLMGLMYGLASLTRDRVEKEDKVGDVCLDFAEWLAKSGAAERDLVAAYCRLMVSDNAKDPSANRIQQAMLTNVHLANIMRQVSKTKGKATKTFLDRLAERPALQGIISKINWGS